MAERFCPVDLPPRGCRRRSPWAPAGLQALAILLLMLGLFTRLAAAGGIGFILLFYLCNPPFIGYFYAIPTEGTYLLVNKNLVELCALVVILLTGTGRFAGLDSIVHGLFVRMRRPRRDRTIRATSGPSQSSPTKDLALRMPIRWCGTSASTW